MQTGFAVWTKKTCLVWARTELAALMPCTFRRLSQWPMEVMLAMASAARTPQEWVRWWENQTAVTCAACAADLSLSQVMASVVWTVTVRKAQKLNPQPMLTRTLILIMLLTIMKVMTRVREKDVVLQINVRVPSVRARAARAGTRAKVPALKIMSVVSRTMEQIVLTTRGNVAHVATQSVEGSHVVWTRTTIVVWTIMEMVVCTKMSTVACIATQ